MKPRRVTIKYKGTVSGKTDKVFGMIDDRRFIAGSKKPLDPMEQRQIQDRAGRFVQMRTHRDMTLQTRNFLRPIAAKAESRILERYGVDVLAGQKTPSQELKLLVAGVNATMEHYHKNLIDENTHTRSLEDVQSLIGIAELRFGKKGADTLVEAAVERHGGRGMPSEVIKAMYNSLRGRLTESNLVDAIKAAEHSEHKNQLTDIALRSGAVAGIDIKKFYSGKISEDAEFMNNLFQARFEQAAKSQSAVEQKDLLIFAMNIHQEALKRGLSMRIYQSQMRGTILQAQLMLNARTGKEII